MTNTDRYTVAQIVETGGFSARLLAILGLCFLLMVCDSYDVAALSFAAPILIKTWGMTSSAMGLIFSAGMLGLLVGSIAFGQVGDRSGRKRAMILGALAFSILTPATALASSEAQLLVLRFLATVGLGGAVPNAVALVTEFSPRRLRVTSVGMIFAGYSCGGIVAGLSAAFIIPKLGWQAMFFIGGALSILTTGAFAVFLPESLSFLAAQPGRHREARRVAASLRPDLHLGDDARIVLQEKLAGESDTDTDTATATDSERVGNGSFRDLFAGNLKLVTPLMWLIYIASSMTVFALTSWMPVAVESIGQSASSAAMATALLYCGSAVGGVAGGRLADRIGLSAIVMMALAAFFAVTSLGRLGDARGLLLPVSFLAGLLAFGGQTCLHGIVGSLYPTRIRANGVGWAIGIAKIGSILGPFIAGLLMPRMSSSMLFLSAGSPLVLVALLAAVLKMLVASSSTGAGRRPAQSPAAAVMEPEAPRSARIA